MSPVWNQPPANALLGRFGIAPVALEHLRAAEDDLASFTGGHGAAVLVPDVEFEEEARTTDAAKFGHDAVAVEERVTRDRLGEAVRVGEPRGGKRSPDALDERDRHLLATVDDEPHR